MKRRKRPEHSWDRLNGTRLEVVELDAGSVRRLCVNTADPMAAIVSYGRHALMAAATGHTLRFLSVDNWNDDNRELAQIPEARAWFRQLWHEGKPLLRVLSESSWDMPADDRLGLSQLDATYLGLGWWDIYVLGCMDVSGAVVESAHGPVFEMEGVGDRTREDVRAELLQMSPDNPEGYTYDDATNRGVFTHNNMPAALKASRAMGAERDMVVLVLSLLDPVAAKLANMVAEPAAIERTMADCRARDLHPAAVVGVPRELAADAVQPFAPEAAARIGKGAPENGWHWGVFVAFNGTTLAILDPPRMEATA